MYRNWGVTDMRGREDAIRGMAYKYVSWNTSESYPTHLYELRTTSKSGDEALVCATMFNYSVAAAGRIDQTPSPERYRVLFRSNNYMPWRIIFLNQKAI